MSDFEQVIIGKNRRVGGGGGGGGREGPTALERARQVGAVTENDRKVAAGGNKGHSGPDHAHLAKLDRDNEVAPPAKIPPTVGKAIGQARQALNWTQKDLGQKINEKPQVIQDYESGKALPNPQIMAKMERALNVKLRGKDIGLPLGGPKKK